MNFRIITFYEHIQGYQHKSQRETASSPDVGKVDIKPSGIPTGLPAR